MDGGDEPEADTFLGVEVPDDPAAPPPGGGEDDANGGGDSAMDGGGDEDAMGDTDGDGDGDGDAEGQDGPDDADLDLDNLGVDDTPPVRDDAIHVCTVHSGPVYAVAAVGPIVATGSGDDTGALLTPDASLADAAAVAAAGTPPPPGTLFPLAHTSRLGESVTAAAVSADGRHAAYGTEGGVVAVRAARAADGAGGVTLFEEATAAVHFVAFHPRGPVVLAGDADGTAWMLNAASSAFMAVFAGHGGAVTCGGWAPDGRTAVTGAADGVVRVWDPKATAVAVAVSNERGDYHPAGVGVVSLGLHPAADTPVGASGGDDGSVYLWSTASGRVLSRVPPHGGSVEAVSFSPTAGEHLVSAALDGTLRVWDVAASAERGAAAHDAGVTAVAWHPAERGLLLSGGLDRTVRLWDARAGGRPVGVWRGHAKAVLDVA